MGALKKVKKAPRLVSPPVAPKCTKKWSKKQQVCQNPHCIYYWCIQRGVAEDNYLSHFDIFKLFNFGDRTRTGVFNVVWP